MSPWYNLILGHTPPSNDTTKKSNWGRPPDLSDKYRYEMKYRNRPGNEDEMRDLFLEGLVTGYRITVDRLREEQEEKAKKKCETKK